MLIAATTQTDGRKLLVLGLYEENVRRLLDDKPILKRFDEEPQNVLGLEEWNVMILGPEDTARFIAQFGDQETR